MRSVRGARREVHEERLVRHQRLLLADPVDRVIGHVLGEVVALLRRAVRLDGHRVLVDRRRVLVRLAADEAVEVLEPRSGGPRVEGTHRARLPYRHLVALAELRRGVAVELERLGKRRGRVRPDRVVARRRGRDLGDTAHADRMVVAAGEQRLPRRRAERGRVEPVVLQAVVSERSAVGVLHGPPNALAAREADIVDQHDQHVGRTGRRPQRLDRREGCVGILRVVGDQAGVGPVGNRQDVSLRLGCHRWRASQTAVSVTTGPACICEGVPASQPRVGARRQSAAFIAMAVKAPLSLQRASDPRGLQLRGCSGLSTAPTASS